MESEKRVLLPHLDVQKLDFAQYSIKKFFPLHFINLKHVLIYV